MNICNRAHITAAIKGLTQEKDIKKDSLIKQVQAIQQSVDPVYLLRRRMSKNKDHVPQLFDNLIDQSFYSATDTLRNKIGLNNDSLVSKAADNLLQKNLSRFFSENRYKIRSVVLAISKNIFR